VKLFDEFDIVHKNMNNKFDYNFSVQVMPLARQRYRRPFSLDAGFDETEEIENIEKLEIENNIEMSSRSTPSSCRRRRSHFMQKKYDSTSTDSSNCSGK
jgi:hypothetical protein